MDRVQSIWITKMKECPKHISIMIKSFFFLLLPLVWAAVPYDVTWLLGDNPQRWWHYLSLSLV